jgi:HEPN domain-containing protein
MRRNPGWLAVAIGVFVVATAIGAAPAPAIAQPRDGALVRMELERTDDLLQRAAEVVQRSGNPRAHGDLQLAHSVQATAWEHFHAMRFLLAHERTMQARELGGRAVRAAQQQGNAEQHAQRLLEDAQEKLERARECIGDPPSEQALRVLQVATTRLEQAREAFHETKYLVAIDMGRQVHRMLDELCGRRPGHHVLGLLDNVRNLLERERQNLESCGPRALAILDRAAEQLARAEEHARAGNHEAATRMAEQAKGLVLQALRDCEGSPDTAEVDRILEEAAAALDRIAGPVRESGNADAVALLDKAHEHLQRARELRERGKLRQVLAEVRVARNLGRRAARLAGAGGF